MIARGRPLSRAQMMERRLEHLLERAERERDRAEEALEDIARLLPLLYSASLWELPELIAELNGKVPLERFHAAGILDILSGEARQDHD